MSVLDRLDYDRATFFLLTICASAALACLFVIAQSLYRLAASMPYVVESLEVMARQGH